MKNLLQKLKTGAEIAAGALILTTVAGCATLGNKEDFPEGHISGVEYTSMDQNQFQYNLEEQVIYGDKQYFQKRDLTDKTLALEILRDEDLIREMDPYSGNTKLISEKKYIPTLVESATSGTDDNLVDGVILTNVYADLTPEKELDKNPANKYGYRRITTQEGANFKIMTMNINGIEYFFPKVADDKIEDGKLSYYLIPVKGATIRLSKEDNQDNKGQIEIRYENQIYRPVLEQDLEDTQGSTQQETEFLN